MKLTTIPHQFRDDWLRRENFGIPAQPLDPYKIARRHQTTSFFPGGAAWFRRADEFRLYLQIPAGKDQPTPTVNDINSVPPGHANPLRPLRHPRPCAARQARFDGLPKNITENIGFNGRSTFHAPKMGITFQGGYDIRGEQADHPVLQPGTTSCLWASVRRPSHLEFKMSRPHRWPTSKKSVDARQHVG